MYVRCAEDEVRLMEVHDLTRLHVEVDSGADGEAPLGILGLMDGEHAWLIVDALRAQAHAGGVDGTWDAEFEAMIEFAEAHGWLSADGKRVRAHVEHAG